jgi:hypothetical protein
LNSRLGITGAARFIRRRQGPAGNQSMSPYRGLSVASAWRTPWIFDRAYRTGKDWLVSGFVPALFVGASLEYQQCRAAVVTLCTDSVKSQRVITPFLDFRLSPTSQFRLGVPIQTSRKGSANATGLSTILVYSLQLSTIPK